MKGDWASTVTACIHLLWLFLSAHSWRRLLPKLAPYVAPVICSNIWAVLFAALVSVHMTAPSVTFELFVCLKYDPVGNSMRIIRPNGDHGLSGDGKVVHLSGSCGDQHGDDVVPCLSYEIWNRIFTCGCRSSLCRCHGWQFSSHLVNVVTSTSQSSLASAIQKFLQWIHCGDIIYW